MPPDTSSPTPSPTLDTLLAETAWVGALARSLIVDPGTADDVAQDAAVIALTRPPSDVRTPRGWFRRVVGRLASNARRGSSRRAVREEAVATADAVEAADEVVARWEIRKRVVEAVLSLDEPYRTAILLRFFDGLSAPETAARLGVPLETVRTRTRRGLDTLRGKLASLDDGRGTRGAAVLLLLARPGWDSAGPRATVVLAGNGVGGAAAGGFVMGMASKWAGAATVILVLGLGVTWGVSHLLDAETRATNAEHAGDTAATTGPKTRRAARPADTGEQDSAAAPDGIDLDRCDRENDLFGVVLDPDAKPVGGATVTAMRARPIATLLDSEAFLEPLAAAEATRTASDGTFALRLRRGDGLGLRVDAAGFALWESNPRQAGERMTIRLARAVDVTVHVRTHHGKAVAGAPVRVHLRTDESGNVMHGSRTDADGRARFDRMPRGAGAYFVAMPATAPQGQTHNLKLADAATQSIDLTLEPGCTIRGGVVDAKTGVGIAGARIRRYETFADAATTDAGGAFVVDDFPLGEEMIVCADAPGYARGMTETSDPEHVRIALEPAVRVTGRVVGTDGAALAGADVYLGTNWASADGRQRSLAAAVAAADGTFVVEGLRPGRSHALRVRVAGRAQHVRSVMTPSQAPYLLDLGDVVLGPSHVVRGVVVDVEGHPIPRASVRISGPGNLGDAAISDWRLADDLGRFAFADLPPGTYEIDGPRTKPTEVSHATVVVPDEGDPAIVTLVLRAAAAKRPTVPVTARVTDEDGNPVAGVNISFGYAANGGSPGSTTGADGVVTIPAEYAPLHVMTSLPAAIRRDWVAPPQSLLRPGQTDVVLVTRRGKLIVGQVLDEHGKPSPSAWVVAYDGASQAGWQTADADGRFAFALPAGRKVDLVAKPQNVGAAAARNVGELWGVEPGTADLIVKVGKDPGTRALDVDVVDEAGAKVAGVTVWAHGRIDDWAFEPIHGATPDNGRVRLDGVRRTGVDVEVLVPDPAGVPNRYWSTFPRRVPGSVDTVRIVVGAPRIVRGRVTREDGAPCGGALVHPNIGHMGSRTMAEVDGSFELRVPADAPVPFVVYASPLPGDPKSPLTGWDLVESTPRDLEIVVRPVPAR